MIFTIGFAVTDAASAFLAFRVLEYSTVTYSEDTNVTKLSVIAFNSAKTMSVANCTFNWTKVQIQKKSDNTVILNDKFTYISNCHENEKDGEYKIQDQVTYGKVLQSTAAFADFKAFDTINIYYDNVLYFSINPTNAATVGFTPLTFFSGKMDPYKWTTEKFSDVTTLISVQKPFSTVDAKLFIAKFQGDYSYLTGTVRDAKDAVLCNLFFTSRNEAICKLQNATDGATAAGTNYFLVLKNAAGNVVVKHGFARIFFNLVLDGNFKITTDEKDVKRLVNQTVERTVISWTIPPAPPATDSKSNPIMTTTFIVNLKDNSTKSAATLDDVTCPLVNVLIQSNGSTIMNAPNTAPTAATGFGYCYIRVTSNTNALVPWTDFIMNATYSENGSTYIATTAKLTPRMISDWAANSVNGSDIIIALSDINKSGLTGGEVAAIVIGSCAGALLVALLAGIFIRWCAYGCMNPAMVAAPKMMM